MKHTLLLAICILISINYSFAQYDEIIPQDNGLSIVRIGDKYGYIDANQMVVVPIKYTNIGSFNEQGLVWVYDGKRYGVYNRDGIAIVPIAYTRLGTFVKERTAMAAPADKFKTLPSNARYDVHDYKYLTPINMSKLDLSFSTYIVVSKQGNGTFDGIVDVYGFEVVPIGKYKYVFMPIDGFVPVASSIENSKPIKYPRKIAESEKNEYAANAILNGTNSGSAYLMNYYNSQTKKLRFNKWLNVDAITPYANGECLIDTRTLCFILEKDGSHTKFVNEILPSDGDVWVANNGSYVFTIDQYCNPTNTKKYSALSAVQPNGLIFAQPFGSEEWGLIDKNGDWVIEAKYTTVHSYSYGYAAVIREGKVGLIDCSGREIVPCDWASIINIGMDSAQYIWVKQTGSDLWHCYSINKRNYAFSEGFGGVRNFNSDIKGYAFVIKNDKFGCINEKGQKTIPFEYDRLQDAVSAMRIRVQDGCSIWTEADELRLQKRIQSQGTDNPKFSLSNTISNNLWDF